MNTPDLARRLTAKQDPLHALDVAHEALETAGLAVDRDRDLGALLARRGEPEVVLSGHVDVVPAGEDWTVAPFGNDWKDGRLHARGASDMRGPVAAMVAALDRTDEPAGIALSSDEETTMDTVRSWVEEGVFEDASLVVVGEPTHLQVAVASKGLVWVRLTARGARGHASTPRGDGGRGPSGPERLVEALANLPARPVRAMHPRVGEATLAVSGLESDPTPFNVLAGEAQARLDVRFPPPKMPQDVVRSLRSHLDLPVEGLEMGFEKREPAFLGEEATGRWARSVLSDAGVDSELVGVDFVSEAGHWQRLTDTLILGPGSISRAHRPDEYIERGELKEGVGAYSALVEAGAPA